ncbi:repressor phrH2 [Halopenitus sp. POP-27]|uniref:repressor phrH2 n=1 Tax=Halopenitus sp. POP-27 TaxID=2994425 RepID=UPI002469752E|nr:repressor phrH2 [Halopenitus sp. POP-27]
MAQLDEHILERLAADGDATAWEIAFDVTGSVSRDRVRSRLGVLANADLVDRYSRTIVPERVESYWRITTWGEQYLSGDVDPSLDRPLPGPRPPYAMRPRRWTSTSSMSSVQPRK